MNDIKDSVFCGITIPFSQIIMFTGRTNYCINTLNAHFNYHEMFSFMIRYVAKENVYFYRRSRLLVGTKSVKMFIFQLVQIQHD